MSATKIVLKHRKFRGSRPYICHGIGAEKDAECESFAAACRAARDMGSTAVSIQRDHAPADAKTVAAKSGIELILL